MKAARSPKPNFPVIIIAQAKTKPEVLAGLARWKERHPAVAALLAAKDVLVDTNRGRSTAWYRVRINPESVPEAQRPPAETPDPNYDWKSEWPGEAW